MRGLTILQVNTPGVFGNVEIEELERRQDAGEVGVMEVMEEKLRIFAREWENCRELARQKRTCRQWLKYGLDKEEIEDTISYDSKRALRDLKRARFALGFRDFSDDEEEARKEKTEEDSEQNSEGRGSGGEGSEGEEGEDEDEYPDLNEEEDGEM